MRQSKTEKIIYSMGLLELCIIYVVYDSPSQYLYNKYTFNVTYMECKNQINDLD